MQYKVETDGIIQLVLLLFHDLEIFDLISSAGLLILILLSLPSTLFASICLFVYLKRSYKEECFCINGMLREMHSKLKDF